MTSQYRTSTPSSIMQPSSVMYSFMDGFSRYNQIMMAVIGKLKMSFTIEWGIYYYLVMPFGLKNVGATYQRMATTLLHDMIHKEIEVYVDDIIVKSPTRERHFEALDKFLERAEKYWSHLSEDVYDLVARHDP